MKHVDMRKLTAAAQEERRRQVIGLRDSGLTYDAIAAQVGLTRTGVFDICRRFAEQGLAGLASGSRGPTPGTGRFLQAEQEVQIRALISRLTPDELGLPFALWSRAAVRELIERHCGAGRGGGAHRATLGGPAGGGYDEPLLGALGLHGPEAAPTRLRAVAEGGAAL